MQLTAGTANTLIFDGTIIDGTAPSPAAQGSFIKAGTGTLLFTGSSTYSGGTTVSAGARDANERSSSSVK